MKPYLISSALLLSIRLPILTPCLSTSAESTPENFPMKIWSVKSLPGEKRLGFLHPRQYYIT